jgi:hypothetical protein
VVQGTGQDQLGGPALKIDLPTCDLNPDDLAIFFLMPPQRSLGRSSHAGMQGVTNKKWNVVQGTNIEDGHCQEFLPGITVSSDGGRIDFEKDQSFAIEEPHRFRAG